MIEIVLDTEASPWVTEEGRLSYILEKNIKRTRFVSIRINSREQVFDALKMFFNVDGVSTKKVGA